MKAYDLPNYVPSHDLSLPYAFADTYPSLLSLPPSDYVRGSRDEVWLKKKLSGLEGLGHHHARDGSRGNGTVGIPRQRQLRHLG